MSASKNLELKALLSHLWNDYATMTPQADDIRHLLQERGESSLVNDHIAIRTFNLEPIGLATLSEPFLELGYTLTGEYHFEEKNLYARSYSHPSGEFPRIFISELLTEQLSESAQKIIAGIVARLPDQITAKQLLFVQSFWPVIDAEDYDALLEESEYAGWMSAFGIRANHFTISVNNLKTFGNLQSLNGFLESRGYQLNGGAHKVQGSPEQFLEQSSTLASTVEHTFEGDETRTIPSCYYEFALRYPVPGSWCIYDGFQAKNADKIFESTDVSNYLRAS